MGKSNCSLFGRAQPGICLGISITTYVQIYPSSSAPFSLFMWDDFCHLQHWEALKAEDLVTCKPKLEQDLGCKWPSCKADPVP